jgi:choline dehydrogenase-like flavoprotein
MKNFETDVVIVGSGAGGSTVAEKLAASGKKILILEKGSKRGRCRQSRRLRHFFLNADFLYDELTEEKIVNRTIDVLYRIGTGGTTIVSSGILVRSLEARLQSLGIDIEKEFTEIAQELNVAPYPEERLGSGAFRLHTAAASLGFKWDPMPKAVNFEKCCFCGKCTHDCLTNSKWTANDFLVKAQSKGVAFYENVTVKEILATNGKALGVKGRLGFEEFRVSADVVILSAGAVETALILMNSGIDRAGNRLFCDPYYVMYDSSDNVRYRKEPSAIINTEFIQSRGFMMANSNVTKLEKIHRRLPLSFKPDVIPAMLGIMVKIKDDSSGKVFRDGRIHKELTSADSEKIISSSSIAYEILSRAGAAHEYAKIRFFPGVHPGGTAAIGDVVDENLETEIENCYVADASVLPEAPGLPPMLTIMALSRRLAKRLSDM